MRKKPRYMLLRGRSDTFIIVERKWYDFSTIPRQRGAEKMWWIVRQSDDLEMLKAMGRLTDRLVYDSVNIEED
jgi:hypothetical protein